MNKRLKFLAVPAIVLVLLIDPAGQKVYAFPQFDVSEKIYGWVASKLSNLLSTPERQITIKGLSGAIPFSAKIEEISVADEIGPWLFINQAVLDWSPLALLKGNYRFEEISAATVKVKRQPQSMPEKKTAAETTPKEKQIFTLPEVPPVRIDKLNINNLVLEKPVLGEQATMSVAGHITEVENESGIEASLRIVRTDEAPRTTADLKVSLVDRQSRVLDLNLLFHEAPNGLIAQALKLPEPGELQLVLQGKGPITQWEGKLQADAGQMGELESTIGLQAKDQIDLAFRGKYQAAPNVLPPDLAPVLGGWNQFKLVSTLAPSDFAQLRNAELWSDIYHVELSGKLSLESRAIQGNWQLNIQDISVLEKLAKQPLSGDLNITGSFAGTTSQPKMDAYIEAQPFNTADVRARKIQTTLHLASLGHAPDPFANIHVTGNGKAFELAAVGREGVPAVSPQWTYDLEIPKEGAIKVNSLEISGEQEHLSVTGRFDPKQLAGTIKASLNVSQLEPYTALLGNPVAGSLRAEADISGEVQTGTLDGTFKSKLHYEQGLPPPVGDLLGAETIVDASVTLKQKNELTLSSLVVKSSALDLNGSGTINLQSKQVDASLKADIAEVEPIASGMNRQISGSLSAQADIGGSLNAMQADATLTGNNLVVNGTRYEKAVARLEASDLLDNPQGKLRLVIFHSNKKLESFVDFDLQDHILKLTPVSLDMPGGKLKGDLRVDLTNNVAAGNLQGNFRNLAPLGQLLGVQLGGAVRFDTHLAEVSGGQEIKLQLKGSGLQTPGGEMQNLDVAANLRDVFQTPQGSLNADIKGYENAGVKIRKADLKASGDSESIKFTASADGRSIQEFNLRTQGRFARKQGTNRVILSSFQGKVADYPVKLQQATTLQLSGDSFSLERLTISFGGGQIQASGKLSPKSISAQAQFSGLPLSAYGEFGGPDLRGSAGGSFKLQGSPAQPTGSFQLDLQDVKFAEAGYKDIPPADLVLDGKIGQNRLEADLELRGITKKPTRANIVLPVDFSVDPFNFSIPQNGKLRGTVSADAQLASLMALVPQDTQILTGDLTANLDLRGTVANPQVFGTAAITKASYTNFDTGTVLEDLQVQLRGDGRRAEIDKFSATDGGSGKISGDGSIDFDPQNLAARLKLDLDRATLVRLNEATATMDGNINLSGPLDDLLVKGNIEIAPAEIAIPKQVAPSIDKLEVIEITKSGTVIKPQKGGQQSILGAGGPKLDMQINLPRKIFVRGRGLDSEWSGQLHVSGTAGNPAINGKLQVVRGSFDFLDRRFQLTKGTIRFFGAAPPNPRIDITAETDAEDITAKLLVSGSISDPKVQLQSTPPLPQDEIAARVLFGRKLNDITPTQAIKLANALRTLSGHGDALDFMTRARRALGLDALDISAGGEGEKGPTVGIGKYLTEDIYLSAEKGTESGTGKTKVEVQITPEISLESKVGVDSSGGIGINWNYDY